MGFFQPVLFSLGAGALCTGESSWSVWRMSITAWVRAWGGQLAPIPWRGPVLFSPGVISPKLSEARAQGWVGWS